MRRYRVQLQRRSHSYLLIEVEARNMKEASAKAMEHAQDNMGDFADSSHDKPTILEIGVIHNPDPLEEAP